MWTFYSRMSLNIFLFLDSPVCISCQWARLCTKWERANLAQMWRANWSDLSWLSLGTGRKRGIRLAVHIWKEINQVSDCLLPSSCAMLCLWLTEALFQMASTTRLPNLEQDIWMYRPWKDTFSWELFGLIQMDCLYKIEKLKMYILQIEKCTAKR